MRIAHLPSSYFPDSIGGTEVYVQTICSELEDLGHRTAVVWHSDSPASEKLENAFPLPAVVPRRRSHLYTKSSETEPLGFRPFLREWKPDVVHFHAFTLGAGNDHAACCRQESIPYVVTYHTPAMSCARGTLLHWGKEPCDGRIDPRRCAACCLEGRGWSKSLARLAAVSPIGHRVLPDSPFTTRFALPSILQESKALWSQFYRGASHVIACAEFCRDVLVVNGVPATQITIQRQALPGIDRERRLRLPLPVQSGKPIRLGYFGRITAVKGPDLLSATAKRLEATGIAATGEWVGPIEGDPRWAQRMFASGAPDVRYAGVKRGNDLVEWIRSCDLIVIPSRWMETGPLTLLEAWDHGTPVIGTDRGGLRDFMTAAGLTECLFAPDSPAEIAAAVNRMLAWNGPAPVVSVPGMRSLAVRMVAVYQHACESRFVHCDA